MIYVVDWYTGMYIYGKFYAILIYKSRKIYEQYNSLFHDNGHQNSGSKKKKKKERRKIVKSP